MTFMSLQRTLVLSILIQMLLSGAAASGSQMVEEKINMCKVQCHAMPADDEPDREKMPSLTELESPPRSDDEESLKVEDKETPFKFQLMSPPSSPPGSDAENEDQDDLTLGPEEEWLVWLQEASKKISASPEDPTTGRLWFAEVDEMLAEQDEIFKMPPMPGFSTASEVTPKSDDDTDKTSVSDRSTSRSASPGGWRKYINFSDDEADELDESTEGTKRTDSGSATGVARNRRSVSKVLWQQMITIV